MLKAYVYSDHELMRVAPFSIEQIERARVSLPESFEKTDPGHADIFWIPIDLGHWEAYHGGAKSIRVGLPRLNHFRGNERRHVAYFCSDGADPVGLPIIMFRQSFYSNGRDENVIAWPYAVEDFGDLVTDDFSLLPYDVSFVGSRVSHKCRIESFDSVWNTPGLRSFLDDSRLHWGSVERTEIGAQRKALFLKSLAESKLVLAARGGGLSSYRFFEAMSAGRIPVLFGDDWELPHQDKIEWDRCMVRIAEAEAARAGSILLDFLSSKTDAELCEMGNYGRTAWLQYLAPRMWDEVMAECVAEKLK